MKSDNFDSDTKTSVIDIETYNTRIKNQSQKKVIQLKDKEFERFQMVVIQILTSQNTISNGIHVFFPCIVRSIKYEVIILLVKANQLIDKR